MNDKVNHPAHYTSHPSGIECIQVTEHMGFNLGNAIKYLWRADLKGDAIEDLRKARWYIDRELQKRGAAAACVELHEQTRATLASLGKPLRLVGELISLHSFPTSADNECGISLLCAGHQRLELEGLSMQQQAQLEPLYGKRVALQIEVAAP